MLVLVVNSIVNAAAAVIFEFETQTAAATTAPTLLLEPGTRKLFHNTFGGKKKTSQEERERERERELFTNALLLLLI